MHRSLHGLLATAVAVTFMAAPGAAQAQQWNAQQTELIERMEACWSYFQESWETWVDDCTHPDSHYWADTTAPIDRDFYRKFYATMYGTEFTWLFSDLRPNMVSIHGDLATTYFNSTWVWRDAKGEVHQEDDKRLEVWIREGGVWKHLRGMAVPVPPAGS